MKSYFFILLTIVALPGFSQTAHSNIKALSAEDIKKLDKSTAVTITINYQSKVDLSKEVSAQQYHDILSQVQTNTPFKSFFQDLNKIYTQLSKENPGKLIRIPKVFTVYGCGGCGCDTPGKAGYALCTGNTCWCACCP
ncbi:hypothetical protein A4H97_14160 [Niastella yeongjuensis]|uniref:Uncharacterized protein n=1 Tax=Niastella yeongjuensis TaxID=354355 RepID=A0A1V9E3U5_9BACT|nr:hypothetical protein [Niastella yeongjuensis]OQP40759.1 hypothetical protein A4H97_14160 [Niastella yeongjuensis]SEP02597.1 hypothetical protein SAMN05660816_04224 [Niastella yeongjuensis]